MTLKKHLCKKNSGVKTTTTQFSSKYLIS